MKIRSVSYERLFNLHDFNNEKFAFHADLGEDEDPKNCMAELAGIVIEIHEVFETYREAVSKLAELEHQLFYEYQSLERTENAMHKQQDEIHKMRAKGQDEYEIACFVKSLRQLREEKAQKEKTIKDLEGKIVEARAIRDSIRNRLKEGKLFGESQ